MIKVMIVIGTRPEVIKMAPVIKELLNRKDEFKTTVIVSAQHRQMTDQVLELFELTPDVDLNIMTEKQQLLDTTSKIIQGLNPFFQAENYDYVLVQGDTTTAFAAALSSFYNKVAVGHVEAGLRTNDIYNPFPEEMNRRMISTLATIHFAPTEMAKQHLLKEGVSEDKIIITGNTVIDALMSISDTVNSDTDEGAKTILVTAHRRENWGEGLENICKAILHITSKNPDVNIVFPVHLNPVVRETVFAHLTGHGQIELMDPLNYQDMIKRIKQSYLVLTDSGGIQEEAPSLGKPVLVLRNETERIEGIEAGTCRLVGNQYERIIKGVKTLLENPNEYKKMAHATNPYGDGKASSRIAESLLKRKQ